MARLAVTRSLNLSLKHLRAVRDVAEFGSFTAAAAQLGMTQPGVSRLVSQVERDLGLSIFLRTTRTVVLTPAGRDFVTTCGRLLDELDAHVASARSVGGYLRGRLVISCLISVTHHMVREALLAFRKLNPDVEVQLLEGMGSEVYENVRNGIADFGIGNAVDLPEDMIAEEVVEEACVGILPSNHALARKKELTLHDLVREPLVSLPLASGLRRLIDNIAAKHGAKLDHKTIVEQFGSLYDVVSAGLGVGIVPPTALPARLPANLTVLPIGSPAIVRRIGILRLRSRGLTPPAQSFLDIFRPRFRATVPRPVPKATNAKRRAR
ncbi:HTH-type transcriptional regulator GltC [Variibacter gotjawalensis]|uniref:HTH-type transcriptional regulator GltC n=1 Tax=Variibacter gotjawalensis TaxID=1333996 RepID=A0A0S3PUU0_9BRAD|nr:LysR family transcriptional regulator [Variibacter gotjawalensis]NIK49910.1 LysR family carnitine catabolism transcriptional activator [Variibacter gotjawalensis]RZS45909.1 LysR family transcriptional regulator [Variibacter gotjawalensis]BAT59584.1 HTH-type transcriptional regulator GltC [Variibacter gotjawalensis]